MRELHKRHFWGQLLQVWALFIFYFFFSFQKPGGFLTSSGSFHNDEMSFLFFFLKEESCVNVFTAEFFLWVCVMSLREKRRVWGLSEWKSCIRAGSKLCCGFFLPFLRQILGFPVSWGLILHPCGAAWTWFYCWSANKIWVFKQLQEPLSIPVPQLVLVIDSFYFKKAFPPWDIFIPANPGGDLDFFL